MIPWIGPAYAAWLRTSARPHPADPHRLVLIPQRIYSVFQQRRLGERVGENELEAMGYPRLPEDDELEVGREEQRAAAQAGDTERLRQVHARIERLEEQAEQARHALETWRRVDPKELAERVAWELAHAPHADPMVGIPPAGATP
jgi:hypothetical protein